MQIEWLIEYDNAMDKYKLYDGLILSQNTNKTLRSIIKKYKYINGHIYHMLNDNIKIIIKNMTKDVTKSFFDNFNSIIKLLTTLGWEIANMQYTTTIDMKPKLKQFKINDLYNLYQNIDIIELKIILEPKFNTTLEKQPKLLYHIAPRKFKSKIKRYGLQPKSNNELFDYSDRLYFFTKYDDVQKYINRFKITKRIDKFDIYKVETENISDIRLMNDPQLKNAVFTLEPIPTYYVELYI